MTWKRGSWRGIKDPGRTQAFAWISRLFGEWGHYRMKRAVSLKCLELLTFNTLRIAKVETLIIPNIEHRQAL